MFDQQSLARWGIFLFVVILSAVIVPYAIVNRSTAFLLILGLIPATIGLIILLRWPDIGPILILITGLVVPLAIGTGTQSSINPPMILVVLLTGLWILQMIVMREAHIKKLSRPFWPAFAIVVSTLLSLGFGQFHWYPIPPASISAQLGGAMIFVLSAAAFVLVAYHLQSLKSLQWLVWVFLGLCALYMVGRIISPIGAVFTPFFEQVASDSMFWMWFGVIAYSQAAFNPKLKLTWRITLAAILGLAIFIAFIQQRAWSSGWVPMLVAIGSCTFIARPRYSIIFGFLLVILLIINSQQAQSMVMIGDNTYSLMTRMEAWTIMFKIILQNPIFGLGPANYYWYTALYPILGYFVQFNSHNNYIDILGQTGVLGLIVFLWFSWENGLLLWRSRFRELKGFERSFLYSCFGGVIGMIAAGMLGDWIFPFVYNVGLRGFRASVLTFLFLGGAVAMLRLIPSTREGSEKPAG